jgi:tyrosinase
MAIRKSAASLSATEQQRFTHGITQLIASGSYGQLVAIHSDMRHDQHGSMGPTGTERFLPWHRDFLLKFEQELQGLDAGAFVPYWPWTDDRTVPGWLVNFHPDVPVPGRRNPIHVRRSLGRRGRLPASWEVDALVQNAGISYTNFTSVLEGFHNEVHSWVGGAMGLISISPSDPLFWLHHAQIDRLWSLWQALPGNGGKGPTLAGPDAILDPWTETATAMSSIAMLGYSYAP